MKVVEDERLINITNELSEKKLGSSAVLNGSLEIFHIDRQKRKSSISGTNAVGTSKPRANTDSWLDNERTEQRKINRENLEKVLNKEAPKAAKKEAEPEKKERKERGGLSPTISGLKREIPTYEEFGRHGLTPPSSSSSSSSSETEKSTVFDSAMETDDEERSTKVAGAGLFPRISTDQEREALTRTRAFSVSTSYDVNSAQQRHPSRSRSGTMDNNERRSRSNSLAKHGDEGEIRQALIEILDESWPDHEFGTASLSSFVKVEGNNSIVAAVKKVNGYLASLCAENQNFLSRLWEDIDKTIAFGVADEKEACDLYSYEPEENDSGDPFQESGVMWSFNYFFHNRESKQILYFTCTAKRTSLSHRGDEDGDFDDDGGDGHYADESDRSIYSDLESSP